MNTQQLTEPTDLTDAERAQVVTFIENYFWKHKKLPTEVHFKMKFNLTPSKEQLEELDEILLNRGLPQFNDTRSLSKLSSTFSPPQIPKLLTEEEKRALSEIQEVKELNPLAVLAANVVLDISDKRSLAAKLKTVGLTTKQWNAFMNDPDFTEWYLERLDQTTKQFSSQAKLGLGTLIGSADLSAIKYWHEFSGEYRPVQQEVIHLQAIISRLMEILVKYVEPSQLILIADEIEGVLVETQGTEVKPKELSPIEAQTQQLIEIAKES